MEFFNNEIVRNINKSILILLIAYVLYKVIIRIIRKALDLEIGRFDIEDRRQQTLDNLFKNLLKVLLIFASVISILNVFGIATSSILASLGVLSVVIGLAIQDILKDILAGVFILIEGNYMVGDLVEIGGFKGTITEIGLKTTKVKAYTGEMKVYANRNISEVINYSVNDVITVIDVKFSFDESKKKAEQIMTKLTSKINKDYEVIIGEAEFLGVQDITETSAIYRVVVASKLEDHFALRRQILGDIKTMFDQAKLKNPYQRIEIKNENV